MDNLDLPRSFGSPPPPEIRGKSFYRKPWFILACALSVFAVVGALSINRIMDTLLHSRPEVTVPNLEQKSLTESLKLVSDKGLSLKQDGTEFDEALPAGTIVRQHPPAGMQVRTGRAIQVVVSKGGQAVFVPNVLSRPLAEAQSLIQNERLQLGAVTSLYSSDLAEGLVISQSPSSGTVVTRGALIDIDVSKGLPPAGAPTVPDFVGHPVDKAKEWAAGVNAEVKVWEDPKGVGTPGTVLKQNPPAGQPLVEGQPFHLSIVPMNAQGAAFQYQVPAEKGQVTVRLIARDSRGESEIYKKVQKGGDLIAIPMSVTSTTRVRVYVDEVLVDEKVIEP